MSEALINPGIVQWAADRAKVNDVSLAKTLGVRFEKLQAWFVGESRSTFLQARKLAKAAQIFTLIHELAHFMDRAERDFRSFPGSAA